MKLLSREEFKTAVFKRDGGRCVVCGKPAVDAHHLIERKLWKDGGYYLDNGVSVCEGCHIQAERMDIETQTLRDLAGIKTIRVPPGLTGVIDKWGNEIIIDEELGTLTQFRYPGPMFHDDGFRKICANKLRLVICRDCKQELILECMCDEP